MQTKILIISDVIWKDTCLSNITKIIDETHPDLILLAGDLVDDKLGLVDGNLVNRNVYWKDVYKFFEFINEHKTRMFFIRGNWDNSPYYERLLTKIKKSPYIKEISEKVEVFNGVKILGLSHAFTNNLKETRIFCEGFQEPLDLVLAHAEYKRRIWLFHLNTKFVVTGHFDKQVCQIRDKVFISLESFPEQYVLIDYKVGEYTIDYFDKGTRKYHLRRARFSNGKLAWDLKPFKHRKRYADKIEKLIAAKARLSLNKTQRQEIVSDLLEHGISKKLIEEYLRIDLRTKVQTGN